MPLYPVPPDPVLSPQLIKALPEVPVLHRLAGSGLPVVVLPGLEPFGHPAPKVLGIGMDFHLTGPFKGFQRLDGGE